jgi:hypothetical protein
MNFTPFQLKLINEISKRNIYDVTSLLQYLDNISLDNYKGISFGVKYENVYLGSQESFEIKTNNKLFTCPLSNFHELSNKFLEYIFLCDYLEKNLLIRPTKISTAIKNFTPLVPKERIDRLNEEYENLFSDFITFLENKEYNGSIPAIVRAELENKFSLSISELYLFVRNTYKFPIIVVFENLINKYQVLVPKEFYVLINQIIAERYSWEFYPSSELMAFINRGNKTFTEYQVEEENKDRKKTIKYPMYIAISTIVISIIANYFIYTNKREVYITNEKDTIDVRMVPLDKIDSSHFRDSSKIDLMNK